MVKSIVDGQTASGWHHHGGRHVYGYIVREEARVEHGPSGNETFEPTTGDCFSIPAGTIHRDINPIDEQQQTIACFVGTGPMVVNVDGPESS